MAAPAKHILSLLAGLTFLFNVNSIAAATPPASCPEEGNSPNKDNVVLDKYEYLRALSLDLRGFTPSPEEYKALSASDDVPVAQVDEWLNSGAFGEQIARLHRSLVWNRVRGSQLLHDNVHLILTWGSQISSPGLFNLFRSDVLRGGYVSCLDKPAQFDPVTGAPV